MSGILLFAVLTIANAAAASDDGNDNNDNDNNDDDNNDDDAAISYSLPVGCPRVCVEQVS